MGKKNFEKKDGDGFVGRGFHPLPGFPCKLQHLCVKQQPGLKTKPMGGSKTVPSRCAANWEFINPGDIRSPIKIMKFD